MGIGENIKRLATLGLAATLGPPAADAAIPKERPAAVGKSIAGELPGSIELKREVEEELRLEKRYGSEEKMKEVVERFQKNYADFMGHVDRLRDMSADNPERWKMLQGRNFGALSIDEFAQVDAVISHLGSVAQALLDIPEPQPLPAGKTYRSVYLTQLPTIKKMDIVNMGLVDFEKLVAGNQLALDAAYAAVVMHGIARPKR